MGILFYRASRVEILFQGRKLEKLCTNQSQRIQAYGPRCAKLLARRLEELGYAANLEGMRSAQRAKCHELTGDAIA